MPEVIDIEENDKKKYRLADFKHAKIGHLL